MNSICTARRWRALAALLALVGLWAEGCVINNPAPEFSSAHRFFDPHYSEWGLILTHYVTAAGVDYARMKRDRIDAQLEIILTELNQVTPEQFDSWARETKMAFLINAHNAHAIMRVLRHYPISSVNQTASFLSSPRGVRNIRLLGRMWSLGALADEVAGYPYHESRAVFLLNWGARGCAPLPPVAVTAENLEFMLQGQTKAFMTDPKNTHYDIKKHIIYVSKLLGWYSDAFDRDYGTVWDFIKKNLSAAELAQINQRKFAPRIRYPNFDNSLNDVSGNIK